MKPNLARIPAAGDSRAQEITRQVQATTIRSLVDSLYESDATALGRYGARQPTIALRQNSAQRLRTALLATALSQLLRYEDTRDLMIGLAVHHFVAKQLGNDPSEIFESVASRLPDGPIPELLREFGARQDITLKGFGWQLIQTAEGPDFMPA